MRRLVYVLPALAFVVLAGFFFVGLQKDPRLLPSVLIHQPVPEFQLAPIKGFDVGLASDDLRGQVSLVNIFGSWCAGCGAEHPFLMELKRRNLVPVHGIDWLEKDPDDGPAWLARFGNPYTLIGDDPRSKAAIAFGVTGAPETFVVDGTGVIRYKRTGPMTQDIWDEKIWPVIQKLRGQ